MMLQTLRRQHNLTEEAYRSMIDHATKGRSTSTRELTQQEAFELIDGLVKSSPKGNRFAERNESSGKMRRKLLAYAREMGWVQKGAMQKVDLERVNEWCRKYGFGKKELRAYSYFELPKLVSQFECGPYKDYLSKL